MLCKQRHIVFATHNLIKRRLKQSVSISNSQLYKLFSGLNIEMLLYLSARASSENIRRFVSLYLTKLRDVVPLCTGNDLLKLGLEPGPLFKRIKNRLLQARLDGEVNNKSEEEMLIKSEISYKI